MSRSIAPLNVKWEKLPPDYPLPDDPVDNITQPALAEALTNSLASNDYLTETAFTCTNYGLCAVVNDKIVLKAPDWAYVAQISVSRRAIERSYTPKLEGEVPKIVMEFLSNASGEEYSIKPTYPQGKWFFYEQILQVPNYVIFKPETGRLEVYELNSSGMYDLRSANENGRYWIAEMNLYLGVWEGSRQNRTGYWLRWWNQQQELLLWDSEIAQREREIAQQERERAERLAEQLRSMGIEPT